MADTGMVFCDLGSNRPISTNPSWSNPSFIVLDDTAEADISLSDFEFSDGIAASDFNFSGIPAGATIDGIITQLGEYYASLGSPENEILRLILADDSDGSENKISEVIAIGSSTIDNQGSSSDLWGETITRADVQDIDWGFFYALEEVGGSSASAFIDYMRMQIYYSLISIDLFSSSTIIGATEAQIAGGGRTIILDLTGVTWLTAGSNFDATRQTIINIVDSQQAETLGWNNEIKAKIGVAQVIRTSDTRVTITLLAAETGSYKIVADEIIDLLSLAASAHSGSTALSSVTSIATITAECDETLAPDSIATQTNLSGSVTDIDESVDSPDANWLLVA